MKTVWFQLLQLKDHGHGVEPGGPGRGRAREDQGLRRLRTVCRVHRDLLGRFAPPSPLPYDDRQPEPDPVLHVFQGEAARLGDPPEETRPLPDL